MTFHQELRARHLAEATDRLPGFVSRLSWPADRIRVERIQRLRALLAVARTKSAWHRARLTAVGIDVERADEDALCLLPPMGKANLQTDFDAIVTQPQLTLEVVEEQLAAPAEEEYLLDTCHAVVSSGSTGIRGVHVYDWEGWTTYFLSGARWVAEDYRRIPALAGGPVRAAILAAAHPAHPSAAIGRTFAAAASDRTGSMPVTLPLLEIVRRLNDLQPDTVNGYPSTLRWLALEAAAGRLAIRPAHVRSFGETLLPEVRSTLRATWGAPVSNQWVTSEAGTLAYSCPGGSGMHLNDDLVVVEPVNQDGQTVPDGEPSAKVFVTCLYNHVLPLIRFEVADSITKLPGRCACGSSFTWIEDVHGRSEDYLAYGAGVTVHPFVLQSPLARQRNVTEYQIHQTATGADVLLKLVGPVNFDGLREELVRSLVAAGVAGAEVNLVPVDYLARQPGGKLKHIFPVAPAG